MDMDLSQREWPLVVSFSGLDGSGKTTQIETLRQVIAQQGLSDTLITFWDDVVVAKRYREGFVHKVFGSEQGIGEPGHPVERRDKNVKAGYLTVVRHLLYLADAVHLRIVLSRARNSGAHVIVTDRYLFDELANLPLENRFSALYARLLARIAPRPHLAFLLDADPELARARKPEYPIDFMRQSRRSYFRLSHLLGNITIVPPLALEDAKSVVLACFQQVREQCQKESSFAGVAPAA
jgi:thymidylate kinase